MLSPGRNELTHLGLNKMANTIETMISIQMYFRERPFLITISLMFAPKSPIDKSALGQVTVWGKSLLPEHVTPNSANPVYGVATICHQVRRLCWGHPSLIHTAHLF